MIKRMESSLPLRTERLLIRRVLPSDVQDVFQIYGNQESARYQLQGPWSVEQVDQMIRAQAAIELGAPGVPLILAAQDNDTARVAGTVELTITSPQDRQAEIGFSFQPAYTGRGLATEAVNACLGIAFVMFEMHRVCAGVDTRNERSWKLMERLGMRREAHFLHANLEGDQWTDDYVYAILDSQWYAQNE